MQATDKADSTLKAYNDDWKRFALWCKENGRIFLPATGETAALFANALMETGRKLATIQRAMSAIANRHVEEQLPNPRLTLVVKRTMKDIERAIGSEPERKEPLTAQELARVVEAVPASLIGLRDRALLLMGFVGAFNRADLVGVMLDDMTWTAEGVNVRVRRSGRIVTIRRGGNPKTCPVRAIREWMAAGGVEKGPLFRWVTRWETVKEAALSDKAVALVVKLSVLAVGLDPSRFSGKSLRFGFVASAVERDITEERIKAQAGYCVGSKLPRHYMKSQAPEPVSSTAFGL